MKSTLTVLYANVRSLLNKLDELKLISFDLKPDVICLCETWTNDTITNSFLTIEDYSLICRKDRNDTNQGIGGGLIIYVKSNILSCEVNYDYVSLYNQCCVVSLTVDTNKRLNIALVYRPHSLYDENNVADNNEKLCNILKQLPKPYVIVGDFNFSDINWDASTSTAKSKQFLDTVNDLFLTQHIDFPTHKSGTMPDLVLSSDQSLILSTESVGILGSSDHDMIFVNIKSPCNMKGTEKASRNWPKADIEQLKSDINIVDWQSEFEGKSTEECWTFFRNTLEGAVDNSVPYNPPRKKGKPLWMNKNTLRKIRKKKKLWKNYRKSQEYEDYLAFKKLENEVKKNVRKAKKDFEKKLAKNSKANPRSFYKYVNSKKSNRDNVGPLKCNNVIIDDDKNMADVLNNFFGSVFVKEDLNNVPEPMKINDTVPNLESLDITAEKVKKKLENVKKFSAPGPDGINPFIVNELSDELCTPLAMIFQKSLEEGYVPDDWKCANVTPIFKKGSKFEAGNYRPVSLTSIVCRAMESVIKDSIVEHLMDNDLIYGSQHGFIPKRSCLTNLLEYFELISDSIDQGDAVDLVYLDFAKAFDKVSHHRLLVLLEAHSISGEILVWIKEWLSGRHQRVVLNGEASGWLSVTSGVPQGSVLGPILFCIYINLVDRYLSDTQVMLSKFADDTKAGMKVNCDSDADELQNIINILCDWAEDWQMEFNTKKCKVMHLGRKNTKFSYTMGGYAPGGTVLSEVKEEKDVGVIISNDLKPSAQCAAAALNANRLVGQMSRAFTYRNKDTWIKLYKVYIRPHLEYAVQAWSPWTKKDIECLENVQRRVVKMTSGLRSLTYEDRLIELDIQSLEARRLRGDMIQTWKVLHHHDNIKEDSLFTRRTAGSATTTRLSSSPFNLEHKRSNLNIRRNSFSNRVVDPWNKLPNFVKESPTLLSFKKDYDKHVKFAI